MAQRYAGETRVLGEQIVRDVDELFIMSSCASRVLRDAQALVAPKGRLEKLRNLFSRRRYNEAIRLLREQPIAFRPEEGLELILRGEKTERERLLGRLDSYQPFTMSFSTLIDEFNLRADRSLTSLDTVESHENSAGPQLRAVQEVIDSVRSAESEIKCGAESDGFFPLQSAFAQLIPAAQAAHSEAVTASVRDPVGALRTSGALARQRADDAKALVQSILQFRAAALPTIHQAAQALESGGVSTKWIGTELDLLSDRCEEIAVESLKQPAAQSIQSLEEGLKKLGDRLAHAAELDKVRREKSQKSVEETTAAIEAAQREIGTALGVEPLRVLCEEGSEPLEYIKFANEQLLAAKGALDRGDVAAAGGSLEAVEANTNEAEAILFATREAFAAHSESTRALQEETARIDGLLPEHERILRDIQHTYAISVLTLGEGDPTHPNANGTLHDNIEEAREHLDAARELLGKSQQAFSQARILEADELLRMVGARHTISVHRLQEIVEKQKRLADCTAANHRSIGELDARVTAFEPTAADARITKGTLEAFERASAAREGGRELTQATAPDPFAAADQIAVATRALDELDARAQSDRESFAEASKGFQFAASQVEMAGRLASQAAADSFADSPQVTSATRDLARLPEALAKLQQDLARPHSDWGALDAEADGLAAEAARIAAVLQNELKQVEAALAEITAAAEAMRRCSSWVGSYGVTISGAPGSPVLEQARERLQRGEYAESGRVAGEVRRSAESALAEASARVGQLRRAEQERIESERRRRQAEESTRRRSYSSGMKTWSPSPSKSIFSSKPSYSSRSSFSSGSGSSRSSFSSRSGVSRSGW